jgi:anti-sigma B factor antagonist
LRKVRVPAEPRTSATLHEGQDDTVRVEVVGTIDLASVNVLAGALTEAVDRRPAAVVVDMRRLRLLSAVGLRALLAGRQRARTEAIGFTVANCPSSAVRVLKITGTYELLT